MLVAIRVSPGWAPAEKVSADNGQVVVDCPLALEMTKAHQRHWLGGQDIWLKDHRRFLLRHALNAKAVAAQSAENVSALAKDRLTGAEIKSALYGHTLRGRDLDTGATWTLVFAADGSFFFSSDCRHATATSESGSIVEISNAVMCWGYLISGGRGCGTLFRVPRETPAQGKEMILWVSYIDRILFSIDE